MEAENNTTRHACGDTSSAEQQSPGETTILDRPDVDNKKLDDPLPFKIMHQYYTVFIINMSLVIYDLVHMGIVLFPFFPNFSIQFSCLNLRKTYLLIYKLCVSSCARDVVQAKLEAVLANIRLGCKLYPVQGHHNNKSCAHNLVQETVEFVPTNARHGCKQYPVQGNHNYKS